MDNFDFDQIPKYKKKRKKQNIKSSHKHEYKDLVLKSTSDIGFGPRDEYVKAKYCSICGKVNDIKFFWNHQEELLKSGLPIIDIGKESVCKIKYIDLYLV